MNKEKARSRDTPKTMSPINHEQEKVAEWLKKVRFKRTLFGGVKESDVWKKIGELNTLYEAALSAERARYDVLLQETIRGAGEEE